MEQKAVKTRSSGNTKSIRSYILGETDKKLDHGDKNQEANLIEIGNSIQVTWKFPSLLRGEH